MLADKADEQDRLLSNRRRLAVELRRLRDRAGLSGRQLAERIGISQSKVSRIEAGLTVPAGPVVAAWATAVSASGTATELLTMLTDAVYNEVHPWSAALRGQVHLQGEIQELENRASAELTYEPTLIPGLLQTADYARRVFTMFEPSYAALDIPAVVAGRLDRQTALFDPARRLSFLITEGALRWRPGPAHVILAQLDRIASLTTLGNVTIGLIPSVAVARTHSPHGFVILVPADRDDQALVMVEMVHANVTVSDDIDVALYRRQWSLLQESAVFGDAARELLGAITADIRRLHAAEDPMTLRARPGSRQPQLGRREPVPDRSAEQELHRGLHHPQEKPQPAILVHDAPTKIGIFARAENKPCLIRLLRVTNYHDSGLVLDEHAPSSTRTVEFGLRPLLGHGRFSFRLRAIHFECPVMRKSLAGRHVFHVQ